MVMLSRPPATIAAFHQLEHCPANLVPALHLVEHAGGHGSARP